MNCINLIENKELKHRIAKRIRIYLSDIIIQIINCDIRSISDCINWLTGNIRSILSYAVYNEETEQLRINYNDLLMNTDKEG